MVKQEQELQIIIKGVGAEKVQAALDKLEQSGGRAQTTVSGFGMKAVAQFNLFNRAVDLGVRAVSALGRELGSAVTLGVDAFETISLINTTLGEQADELRAWSDDATSAMIQTRMEVERQAAGFFDMARGMGVADEAAFDMGTGMTDLTADVASFYNLPTEEVYRKMAGAMTGYYMNLRSFGVVITTAQVKQEALAMSGKHAADELSQADLVAARYKLILEGLNTATGDVERTSGALSNATRALAAHYTELKTGIGLVIGESESAQYTFATLVDVTGDVVVRTSDWISENKELTESLVKGVGQATLATAEGVVVLTGGISMLVQAAGMAATSIDLLTAAKEGNIARTVELSMELAREREGLKDTYIDTAQLTVKIEAARAKLSELSLNVSDESGPALSDLSGGLAVAGDAADVAAEKVGKLNSAVSKSATWDSFFHRADEQLTGRGFGAIFDKAFGDFPGTRQADRDGYDGGGGGGDGDSYAAASAFASASIGGGLLPAGDSRYPHHSIHAADTPRARAAEQAILEGRWGGVPRAGGESRALYDASPGGAFSMPWSTNQFQTSFRTGGFGTGQPGTAGNPIHVRVTGESMTLAEEVAAA